MNTGISIHIGLNFVDPNAYGGWNGQLSGCINDANAMKQIADGLGYQSSLLIDSQATAASVIAEIGRSAQRLCTGDILFLTYSGHGSQVNDVNGDEDDKLDETWVLWDRMLIDDELYALWAQFQPGVRIIMLSDSCHSGTMARAIQSQQMAEAIGVRARNMPTVYRFMPPDKIRDLYNNDRNFRDTHDTAQWIAGPSERAVVNASLILISGCQDNQLSLDGNVNGLFTEKLLETWGNGTFVGDYRKFWRDIAVRMPASQSPNLFSTGVNNPCFEAQTPFSIAACVPGPTPVIPITPATARPTLRMGSRGPDVIYLQQRLNANSYQVTVDGDFGPSTRSQVIAFQVDKRLTADGVVGSMTWQALQQGATVAPTPSPAPQPVPVTRPVLRPGSRGPDVVYLQQRLSAHGYQVNADGDFGPNTRTQVVAFQVDNQLSPDGVVGQMSWRALDQTPRSDSPMLTGTLPTDTRSGPVNGPLAGQYPELKLGDSGEAVSRFQKLLSDDGYFVPNDGYFGESMASAIRSFQVSHGMNVDGIANAETWKALEAQIRANQYFATR